MGLSESEQKEIGHDDSILIKEMSHGVTLGML
jgi:hypothetical protein